jgi:hypothetical protein
MAFLLSLNDMHFQQEVKPSKLPDLQGFSEKVSRDILSY